MEDIPSKLSFRTREDRATPLREPPPPDCPADWPWLRHSASRLLGEHTQARSLYAYCIYVGTYNATLRDQYKKEKKKKKPFRYHLLS